MEEETEMQQPAFAFNVQTAMVERKPNGILYYILPPLLVAAVFAYCALSESPATAKKPEEKTVKKAQSRD